MRILYIGNVHGFTGAQRYYSIPQRLINGFTRAGHTVHVFNDRDWARFSNPFHSRSLGARSVGPNVLKVCDDLRPHLVVLSNCEMLTNETVHTIKTRWPGTRVAYRNVDSLDMKHNRERILGRVGVVDAIFLTSDVSSIDPGDPATTFHFMPNPVDASIDVAASHERDAHTYDILFAGNRIRESADPRPAFLHHVETALKKSARVGFFGSVVGQPTVGGHAYIELLGQAYMGLSLDREDSHALYASDRMSQYLGNGLLTLVKAGKGFEAFFDEHHVVWYRSAEDVVAAVDRFTKDRDTGRTIATAGHARIHDLFACDMVARWIIDRSFGEDRPTGVAWEMG